MVYWIHELISYVHGYNWDSPLSFGLIVLAVLMLSGRWKIIFISLATVVLAVVARDLIVMNIRTMQEVITMPVVVYCIGGVIVAGISVLGFIRFMIST